MAVNQNKLADVYHTTEKPNNRLSFTGKHYVVGVDADEKEMPNGRFIFFVVDSPENQGRVLRGETFCDWRVKDKDLIREAAIAVAARRLGSVKRATREVDLVISVGGMLFPKSATKHLAVKRDKEFGDAK